MQKTTFSGVVTTFVVSYGFWLLLTWSVAPQELIAGAVVCFFVALFSSRFFIHDHSFWMLNPIRILKALYYSFVTFIIELVKANVDMAKRCFGGCKNVNPGIVKIPVDLESDYAQNILANSITLTPGTMTLEITEEEGQTYYYIHWIDVQAPSGKEAGDMIKANLEKGIRRIWK